MDVEIEIGWAVGHLHQRTEPISLQMEVFKAVGIGENATGCGLNRGQGTIDFLFVREAPHRHR